MDVSELSFAKYCSIMSQPNPPITGIPVFVSRVYRHSAWYVAADGPVREVADLAGKRIGIPEWSQTATVYARGWLAEDAGIPLEDVEWVQAGVNEPGRIELAHLKLPEGIRYRQVPERSLTEMLLAGDIDALISARPPRAFLDGDTRIERLSPTTARRSRTISSGPGSTDHAHRRAPPRHLRKASVDRDEPAERVRGGQEAERRAAHQRHPFADPGAVDYDMVPELGSDISPTAITGPYGIEPNRPTIEAFLRFCYDQGLCHRKLSPRTFTRGSAVGIPRLTAGAPALWCGAFPIHCPDREAP